MATDKPTDEDLLHATPGDAEAFGVFYRRHASAVLAYLLYRTRDAERALDLTAETFAAALQSCHRFRPVKGPARAWLFGIARNVLSDSERRRTGSERARRRLGIEPLVFEDPELARVERLIDLERSDLPLTTLVGDLPPTQRDAVLGRIVDERGYAELAAEHDVSEHTIRQRVSRGLAYVAARARRTGNA
jgi:RNA polymerase sigma-70 factor, ECF subfamily